MQSALEKVKGVKEVKVSLSDHEAVVKYDPAACEVDDLLKAVKNSKLRPTRTSFIQVSLNKSYPAGVEPITNFVNT